MSAEIVPPNTISSGFLSLEWSPDRRRLVLGAQETIGAVFQYNIHVINSDGTGEIRLSNFPVSYVYDFDILPNWRPLDKILPVSNISITPSANSNGWNNSDIIGGISATDDQFGSGIQNVKYGITGAQLIGNTIINNNFANFSVFSEGVSTISYSAKDNADNAETSKTLTVKIDKSQPISQHTSTINGQQTTFTLTATDAISGISEIIYTIDGGTPQVYSAPFSVSNIGGHYVNYYARDFAGNEEIQRTVYVNAAQVPKSVLISEFRTRGSLGADDEFIELYNNGDSSVNISGWTVNTRQGTAVPTTLATIGSGIVIPARGHFLLRKAGSGNYSLSSYAEADQTYTGALADNGGIMLSSNSSVTIDAVGFSGVDATYREGTGLAPSTGITTNGQYSFIRNFTVGALPVDSNNNRSDFIFVSTDGSTFNNLKAVLGSPGPENLNSPTYREGNILINQVDDKVTLAEAPNILYDYSSTSTAYPIGILSTRRKLTNTTGNTVTGMKIRITAITTKNSPSVFIRQAVLRMINSSNITVTSLDGQRTFPVKGVTIENLPSIIDGGLNSAFIIDLGTTGLANNDSLNVDLKSGIVSNGQFKLEFRVETLPNN